MVHIQHRHLTRRARRLLHDGHRLFTGRTACTENFNRSFGCHRLIFPCPSISRLLGLCVFWVSSLRSGILRECELREGIFTTTAAPTRLIACTVLLGRRGGGEYGERLESCGTHCFSFL